MSDKEEWSEWFEHDGKGCPCVGKKVWVVIGVNRDGLDPAVDNGPWKRGWVPISNVEAVGIADGPEGWCGDLHDAYPVIFYRIRKPRGLTILENLIADLPAPVGKVDA